MTFSRVGFSNRIPKVCESPETRKASGEIPHSSLFQPIPSPLFRVPRRNDYNRGKLPSAPPIVRLLSPQGRGPFLISKEHRSGVRNQKSEPSSRGFEDDTFGLHDNNPWALLIVLCVNVILRIMNSADHRTLVHK